jgi:hypothetical protein
MGKKLWDISIAMQKIFHSMHFHDGPGAVSLRETIFSSPLLFQG